MVKKIRLLGIICILCITVTYGAPTFSAVSAGMGNITAPLTTEDLLSLSPKNFEKLTGQHLSFKEKIAFKIMQWKLQKQLKALEKEDGDISKAEKHSKNALFCGIATWGLLLLGLAIPVAGILSIPFAISAIIYGAVSLNKTSDNTRSILGIVLGGLYLVLFALALLVLISILN
ncbi:hypothetical protein [Ferruginibacter sp. SUN106]|uniref:hypothetical protein n=1 Tax=Ferruginibacter sp. SUN106 TaxID=2978348 RepID=UPI003D35C8EA